MSEPRNIEPEKPGGRRAMARRVGVWLIFLPVLLGLLLLVYLFVSAGAALLERS